MMLADQGNEPSTALAGVDMEPIQRRESCAKAEL